MKKKFILLMVLLFLPFFISCDANMSLDPEPSSQSNDDLSDIGAPDVLLERSVPENPEGSSDDVFHVKPGLKSGFNNRNGVSIDDSLWTIHNP